MTTILQGGLLGKVWKPLPWDGIRIVKKVYRGDLSLPHYLIELEGIMN